MMNRRDLLIGGGCLASAGAAMALTPRHRLLLAHGGNLEKALPDRFAGWQRAESNAIVAPRNEDDLASKLYSQIITRLFQRGDTGDHAMLLIAYGDTQNDLLQLHRPEVCYAAFGFHISDSNAVSIPVAPGVMLPARELTATTPERVEHISYWTRIGEYLPVSGRDQRWAKLRTQMAGQIPDGVLVRISSNMDDADASFAVNRRFAADMLHAIKPALLPALIGTGPSLALRRDERAARA